MKLPIHPPIPRRHRGGWALLVTLTLVTCAAMVLAGVMNWANTSAAVISHNNEYYLTTYAAESATEKALSGIIADYENYGEPLVYSKLSTYSNAVPSSSDDPYWGDYRFSGTSGQTNTVVVNRINPTNVVQLGPPYQGLYMLAATYEVISTAVKSASEYKISTAVGQQVNLGTIPIFQFAIFYQNTMEIDPGANMNIAGLVHGNANIYLSPAQQLNFSNDVSSSGTIMLSENPLDPIAPGAGTPNFGTNQHLSGVNPLVLPVGTNTTGGTTNISQNVNAIIQVPPTGESYTSGVGTNRLFNHADMIILVSNNSVTVTSGPILNNQATVISNGEWSIFLSTNASGNFTDQRNGLIAQAVTLDVGKLKTWSGTNNDLRPALGNRDLSSVFVADFRSTSNQVITTNVVINTNIIPTNTTFAPAGGTYNPPAITNTVVTTNTVSPTFGTYLGSVTNLSSPTRFKYALITSYNYNAVFKSTNTSYITNYNVTSLPAVVLTNGATLPSLGLAVVTPDPAYIIGNYNVSLDGVTMYTGSRDTSHTRPAAVYSDALTVLSPSWNPANSGAGIGSRNAGSDTVNAAILTGNVPSDGVNYSGGVENFMRFLEDWNGDTLTYNGSLVAMFSSQIASYPWPGTGTVYNPPTRNWSFDLNFNNSTKLPPLTPRVIAVNRASWTFLNPNTTQF